MTTTKAIRIQGVGMVSAVRADELVVGDIEVRNYGTRYRVATIERVTARFLAVALVELQWTTDGDVDGRVWNVRMREDRMVAISDRARAAAVSEAA